MRLVELENGVIRVVLAPEVGGRIISFRDLESGYEFLWRNSSVPLRRESPGSEYDPNFYGGIDELLPNDIPEEISGVHCPDHGELWTAAFCVLQADSVSLEMEAYLPGVQFEVFRRITLDGFSCRVETRITNRGPVTRPFLWKLHAALAILPGDQITCPATHYEAADPEWSRRGGAGLWMGEMVPEFDQTTEFLYLTGLRDGVCAWSREGKSFTVEFDPAVFPYAWYFASYGGFDGHRVAILEPASAMPISVNDAARHGQCSVLQPGESLQTRYTYKGTVNEN